MKQMLKSLMSVAAAALALTSCSNDATEDRILKDAPKTLEVNAAIDRTRTSMAADHVDLQWSEGDEIYLYIGETAAKADVIKHTIGGDPIKAVYNEGDNVYANYSLDNSYSNGVKEVEINIVAAQKQTEANVFAGVNLPMVAKGTIAGGKVDLTFKPVGCVLVFNVYGPVVDEKIKSIKFETSVGCCGYTKCDLTADALGYTPYKNNTSATVTLGTPAAIGAAKPGDTKIGENQVYLVVAPVNYADAKITVTAESGQTYTFVTANGIDCSASTARVVNLNLAKAPEMQPAIEVPAVAQQPSTAGDFQIDGISFKNIAAEEIPNTEVGVYSDAELTQPFGENAWLTISNTANLAAGQLTCQIAANETAEDRTAYIAIKCAGVQAVIAVTQVAQGSKPATPDPIAADLSTFVESNYGEYSNETWIVTCAGGRNSFGSNSTSANVAKCTLANYPAVAKALGFEPSDKAAAIISKIALPAGYNTVTLEYSRVRAATKVGVAFSTDGANWGEIMPLTDLKSVNSGGSQTYSFPQQGAGYYAFVAKAVAADSRIQTCKITYSQK